MSVVALVIVSLAAIPPISPEARLAEARQHYDLAAAQQLVRDLEAAPPGNDSRLLLPKALLLLGELQRIEYEALPSDAWSDRRRLGKDMDNAATDGLKRLESYPETSERWRIRADLLGLMIRTEFQAVRHRKDMVAAAEKAIALDPANGRAYASLAKPYLFADPGKGQDLEKAKTLLDKAMELAPDDESIQLLAAFALERLGRIDDAKKLYSAILKKNPACKPAQRALDQFDAKEDISSS